MRKSEQNTKAAEEALKLIREGQDHDLHSPLRFQWHEEQKTKCYNGAYVQLLAAFGKYIYRHCDTLLESTGTDDIFRETFKSARNGMPQFRGTHGIASLIAWLRKIATNLCLEELERRQTEIQEEKENFLEQRVVDMSIHHSNPSHRHYRWWEDIPQELLRQAIRKLSNDSDDKDKYILRMKMCQDMPTREIADIFDMTESAVNARIHRAAIRVKSILGL